MKPVAFAIVAFLLMFACADRKGVSRREATSPNDWTSWVCKGVAVVTKGCELRSEAMDWVGKAPPLEAFPPAMAILGGVALLVSIVVCKWK
jgi:hypothetical protein